MNMEIIANAVQTVAANQNVYFTDSITSGSVSIQHRAGSGLVTLIGNTCQCRARFKVSFGGNIALPADGVAAPISLALTINGEAVPSTIMTVTPTVVDAFFNVFSSVFIDVPRGCCVTISVKNITDVDVDVQNANLIVDRVA
jgi:hypothetical protein